MFKKKEKKRKETPVLGAWCCRCEEAQAWMPQPPACHRLQGCCGRGWGLRKTQRAAKNPLVISGLDSSLQAGVLWGPAHLGSRSVAWMIWGDVPGQTPMKIHKVKLSPEKLTRLPFSHLGLWLDFPKQGGAPWIYLYYRIYMTHVHFFCYNEIEESMSGRNRAGPYGAFPGQPSPTSSASAPLWST